LEIKQKAWRTPTIRALLLLLLSLSLLFTNSTSVKDFIRIQPLEKNGSKRGIIIIKKTAER
jgi:hypothetical protein